ncbi:MAG: M23 family metallopeptidase [Vampirovibrionales bacterium]
MMNSGILHRSDSSVDTSVSADESFSVLQALHPAPRLVSSSPDATPFKWVSVASEHRECCTSGEDPMLSGVPTSEAMMPSSDSPSASQQPLHRHQEAQATLETLEQLLALRSTESQVDVSVVSEHVLWVSVSQEALAENTSVTPHSKHSAIVMPEAGVSQPDVPLNQTSNQQEGVSHPMAQVVTSSFYPLRHIRHRIKQRWLSLASSVESPVDVVQTASKPSHYIWLLHKFRQRQAECLTSLVVLVLWVMGVWQAFFYPKQTVQAHATWEGRAKVRPQYTPVAVVLQEEVLKTHADFQDWQEKFLESDDQTSLAFVHDIAEMEATMKQRADDQTTYTQRVQRYQKQQAKLKALRQALLERLTFKLAIPVRGLITSHFGHRWGRQHLGLDVSAPVGSTIMASEDGTVTSVRFEQGYGLTVEVAHSHGFRTRYAHCQEAFVRVGQKVSQGQAIAAVGMTGNTTGPHVHFEVKRQGRTVDPEVFLGRSLASMQ